MIVEEHFSKLVVTFLECETRSVTPTSEFADKQIDIDEEFAAVGIKKFTTTTKTQRVTTAVHKRA